MTVKVTKPAVNVREKLSELDSPILDRLSEAGEGLSLQGNLTVSNDVTIKGLLDITATGVGDTIAIDRTDNTKNGFIKHLTGGTADWIVGQRNTTDSDYHIYSYGAASDVLTIARSTGNATFAGDVTTADLFVGSSDNDLLASYDHLRIGNAGWMGSIDSGNENLFIGSNVKLNAAGSYEYIMTNEAAMYRMGDGTHKFYTDASGTGGTTFTPTLALTIDSSQNATFAGDVQIRTASTPTLDFYSTVGAVSLGDISGDIATGNLIIDGTNRVVFQTGGTEKVRIDSSGNVGIGATSPSSQNSVFKEVIGSSSDSNSGSVLVTSSTGSGWLGWNDAESATIPAYIKYDHSTDSMQFQANSAERMRIDSSGNVGIGTSSPSSLLHVKGSLRLEDSTDTTTRDHVLSVTTGGSLTFTESVGGERMRINWDGNVGIGTNSPVSLLEVSGESGASVLTLNRSNTNTTGSVGVVNFSASDDHSVAAIAAMGDGDNEGAHLAFYTTSAAASSAFNTNERMRILSSGGITFNGDTAAANALDDYEEGTFTATATPSGSGTITLKTTQDTLSYTKIGNLVNVRGLLAVNAVSTPTGTHVDINLPFTVATLTETSDYPAVAVWVNGVNAANCADFTGIIDGGISTIRISLGNGTSISASCAQEFIANTEVAVDVSYPAA